MTGEPSDQSYPLKMKKNQFLKVPYFKENHVWLAKSFLRCYIKHTFKFDHARSVRPGGAICLQVVRRVIMAGRRENHIYFKEKLWLTLQ
jgi:hypothetical protein